MSHDAPWTGLTCARPDGHPPGCVSEASAGANVESHQEVDQ